MNIRGSGVLAHLSSLPSEFGIGDMGPKAFRFADMLRSAGQSYWQILPLGPTSPAIGNSPYSSCSAFAGNSLYISPVQLVQDGWLEAGHIQELFEDREENGEDRVDFERVEARKQQMLRKAFEQSEHMLHEHEEFKRFVDGNGWWLEDYVAFVTIKDRMGGAEWSHWPEELRDRHDHAMQGMKHEAAREFIFQRFVQYLFHSQWMRLKKHFNELGIRIIGDLPIYVTYDSADVWSNRHYFKLDEHRRPYKVAGVPPDYFSETGQRWGNPVYYWDRMEHDGYSWWIRRMKRNLQLFDIVRLDHFRGFAAYWEIPAHEETAINGTWVDGPGERLFKGMARYFPQLPIIAEDLGVITADVHLLRKSMGFPGMKILQFAFGNGDGSNPDALHNHRLDNVVYTGTHDNNTVLGWFQGEASKEERNHFLTYMGSENDESAINQKMIRLAMMSVANTAVITMQDILGLDETGRMNTPSVAKGNWGWRFGEQVLHEELFNQLKDMTLLYGRMA